jgi:hypothetical protein
VRGAAGRGFARDVKLFTFAGEVVLALVIHGRTSAGPGRFEYGLFCDHALRGCPRGVDPAAVAYLIGSDLHFVPRPRRDGAAGPVDPMEAPLGMGAMRRLSAALGAALGAALRVDWYESASGGPVLSELTFNSCMDNIQSCWVHRPPLSYYLGARWRGLEGGGEVMRTPCWFPPDWEGAIWTCAGFGTHNLTSLIRANCREDDAADRADARKWRGLAQEIAVLLASHAPSPTAPIRAPS